MERRRRGEPCRTITTVTSGAGRRRRPLELAPGQHTLQLPLGDHNHSPHDPPVMSEKSTITVR